MVGRALEADADMRLGPHCVEQGARDPRLADAGLADQQHALALAALGLAPALQQQRQLLVAADHRQESSTTPGLEAAAGGTFAQHRERRHRHRQAFQRLRRQRRQLERTADQLPRGLGDHHLARFGHALQPGRQIGRLADHRLLLRRPLADQLADHDQARRDADPTGERRLASAEPPDRRDNRQPGPNSALGLVLMRHRPAEIGQHAVAHELRDMAFETQDLTGHGVLVASQNIAHLLRVELRRKRRRADEIDEHYCELAALGGDGHRRGGAVGLLRLFGRLISKLADRSKEQLARPERQAELLEVGLGELRQNLDGDLVLGKDIDILAEADRRKPSLDPVSQLTPPGGLPLDFGS